MGGSKPDGETATTSKKHSRIRHDSDDEDFVPNKGGGGGMGFLSGFQRSEEEPTEAGTHRHDDYHGQDGSGKEESNETTEKGPMEPELTPRERRERKVAEARIRYLQRKGLVLEQ